MKKKVTAMFIGLCVAIGAIGGCGADKPESTEANATGGTLETEDSGAESPEAESPEDSEEAVKEETKPEYYLAKYSYYEHWNSEDGEGTRRETKEYDADGNLTREGSFSENPFLSEGFDTQYNADGNPIREDYYGNPGGEEGAEPVMTGWCDYEYDADGNLIRELSYSTFEETYDNDFNIVYIYHEEGFPSGLTEYDSNGNVLKRISYDGSGQASKRSENTYDEKENHSTHVEYIYQVYDEAKGGLVYNEEGILDFRDETEYNAAGSRVKTTRYGADEEIFYVMEWEYDSSDRLLAETTTYTQDGTEEKTEYTYDANGNCTSIKYSYGWMSEYEYDANGNQIKATDYDESGAGRVQFEAEYDANGNEIMRKAYNYDFDGNISVSEFTSSYDDSGNLLERKNTGELLGDSWNKYEYDAKGNMTKMTKLDQEGNVLRESSYEYNDEGVVTKYLTTDGAGNSAEYDGQNFLLSKTVDGQELTITEEHDEAGNLTKRSFSDSTGVVEEYEFTYAEK